MHLSYPENPTTIGGYIRKKRMDLKLLQSDVANILNVSPDCITNWENNKNQPQVNYFPRIIKFLGFFPFEIDTTTLMGKLKAYRYQNGLSQKKLGKTLNVDATTILGWELGQRKPSKKMLTKLHDVLKEK
jgi:transcriptional regulator with XRE-family HTH domain